MKNLSVIIPVFNPNELLYETIERVSDQLSEGDEIILGFDSNDENSKFIISKIQKRYFKCRILLNEKKFGHILNMNNGALSAKNNYLMFLGQDDLIAKDFVSTALPLFDLYDVILSRVIKFYKDVPINTNEEVNLFRLGDKFETAYGWGKIKNVHFSIQGMIIRKKIFEELGGFSSVSRVEDHELFIRLSDDQNIKTIVRTYPPAYYRRSIVSISGKPFKTLKDDFLVLKKHFHGAIFLILCARRFLSHINSMFNYFLQAKR